MSKKRYPPSHPTSDLYLNPLYPKNDAQQRYLNALRENTVTFCTGPAGTSKTFLATYVALEVLLHGKADRLVMTRPIVATEDIGYLPGDLETKLHPYILPLYDAIELHVGPTKAKALFDDGCIELLPLAYMRGRSLRNAVLLLDEAQNTTREQMKMFLTRLASGSRVFVNGDVTQSDLPGHVDGGLTWAVERLTGVDSSIGVITFGTGHVVRHPLIETMLKHLESGRRRPEPKVFPALLGRTA